MCMSMLRKGGERVIDGGGYDLEVLEYIYGILDTLGSEGEDSST